MKLSVLVRESGVVSFIVLIQTWDTRSVPQQIVQGETSQERHLYNS